MTIEKISINNVEKSNHRRDIRLDRRRYIDSPWYSASYNAQYLQAGQLHLQPRHQFWCPGRRGQLRHSQRGLSIRLERHLMQHVRPDPVLQTTPKRLLTVALVGVWVKVANVNMAPSSLFYPGVRFEKLGGFLLGNWKRQAVSIDQHGFVTVRGSSVGSQMVYFWFIDHYC